MLSTVKDLGNGVYVFPADVKFEKTLLQWRGAHPELKVLSVTAGPSEMEACNYAKQEVVIPQIEEAKFAHRENLDMRGLFSTIGNMIVLTEIKKSANN